MKQLFISVLFTLIAGLSAQATVRYVKIGGSVDANNAINAVSWTAACPDLQAVINVSNAGDVIWVAAGIYKPIRRADNLTVISLNNRNNAFVLKKDVKIFGGFAGTETALDQRTGTPANASTLSGDIDGNTILNNKNAYHVIVSVGDAGAALLDGFTVTGGYALEPEDDNTNITVNGESVWRLAGGGINCHNSSPALTNLIIKNNTAEIYGGGIYNRNGASPQLTNVTISGNTAAFGGGIANYGNTSPQLTNVLVSGNSAEVGGGIYNYYNASPLLTNVTISGNAASEIAGGVYNQTSSSPIHHNTIIWGNGQTDVFNFESNPVYAYSLVTGQTQAGSNGNMDGNTNPLFEQGIGSNQAPTTNGDYRIKLTSPLLNKGSNALYLADRKIANFNNETDLSGNSRLYANTIDLGAYEFPIHIQPSADGTVYVKAGANGDGSSWANAYPNLAYPLMIAKEFAIVKRIWVASGTYYPEYKAAETDNTGQTTDRDKSFVLVKNIAVYGSFAGNETSPDQRPVTAANTTILSGDLNKNGAVDANDAYHVVIAAGDVGSALLDGFTITGGNTSAYSNNYISVNGEQITRHGGGGIHVAHASPHFNRLTIRNNFATYGGGVYCIKAASPTLTNILVRNNSATETGGGIFSSASSPVFANTTVVNNTAKTGNGIYNASTSSTRFYNAILWNNGTNGIFNESAGTLTYSYSVVQNAQTGGKWNTAIGSDGGGNIDVDPLFTNVSANNFNLEPCSPAINTGNNDLYLSAALVSSFANEKDLAGASRLISTRVDMGAFEASVIKIRPTLTPAPSQTITFGGKVNIFTLTGTPPWTVVYNDGSNNKTLTGLTTPTYTLTPTAVGVYTFAPISVQDVNCSNTLLSGTTVITVEKAQQTIKFTPPTVMQVEKNIYTLTATATSGLPVLFKLRPADSELAEITGNNLRLKQSGSIVVTAYTAANPNYFDAPEVPVTISLTSNNISASFTVQGASLVSSNKYLVNTPNVTEISINVTTSDRNAKVEYKGVSGKSFVVAVNRAGTQTVTFTVVSQDGTNRKDYTFTVEQQLNFDAYVATKWDNTFILNIRKFTEEKFEINACRWYEDAKALGTGLTYSKGNLKTDVFKPGSVYHFELDTKEGVVRSSGKVFAAKKSIENSALHIYPNPVTQNQKLTVEIDEADNYLENTPIRIYSLSGVFVKQLNTTGRLREINLSLPAGAYILKVEDKEMKVIVK
ncbi:MAG: T9SS type A sorting domain-containing protein [Dysgonamonadaceae bacterium]|jgi:hypothetical protein|nr:T9SS type A sorting domain-containing protein [Dysgonamonadaceae bacterium]